MYTNKTKAPRKPASPKPQLSATTSASDPRPLESLRTAQREAETVADLARAQQLAEEARLLIVSDYARAASTVPETLARLAAIDSEVRALNGGLPPDTAGIQNRGDSWPSRAIGETAVLSELSAEQAD